jgi:hypothetical protein
MKDVPIVNVAEPLEIAADSETQHKVKKKWKSSQGTVTNLIQEICENSTWIYMDH